MSSDALIILGIFISGVFSLLLLTAAIWQMLVKMNEPGVFAIIPVANMFVLAKHIYGTGWAMVLCIFPIVGPLMFFGKLFQGFGADPLIAACLAFFAPPLGLLIYGFNDSPWQGL